MPGTSSVRGRRARRVNHPTTHVEAPMEISRDAGSIPAASTGGHLRNHSRVTFSFGIPCFGATARGIFPSARFKTGLKHFQNSPFRHRQRGWYFSPLYRHAPKNPRADAQRPILEHFAILPARVFQAPQKSKNSAGYREPFNLAYAIAGVRLNASFRPPRECAEDQQPRQSSKGSASLAGLPSNRRFPCRR